jgi:hypothetical protein
MSEQKKIELTAAEMESPILRYFRHDHLPSGDLKGTSAQFANLAHWTVENVPNGPERTVALRKLLEAKDAALRAALAK